MMKYNLILLIAAFGCSQNEDQPDAFGNFEADEILISAEAGGKLVAMDISEGDKIKAGQLLAMVDTTQLYLKKGQLIAAMSALRMKLQNIPDQLNVYSEQEAVLAKELDRIGQLKKDGAATQKQWDDMEGQLKIVRKQRTAIESQLSTGNRGLLAELKPLEWQLKQLEDGITKSQILAPIDGTVLTKYKYQGEVTGVGQPLVKLADLSKMTLRAYVGATQLSQISIGKEVSVSIDGADGALENFKGTISWVANEAEFTPKTIQTRSERVNQVYAIKVLVDNNGKIKIGMPAEVTF